MRGDLNASKIGGSERGQAISDRDVETIVMRVLTNKLGLNERMVQELQALAGLRGEVATQSRPREAVRRQDIAVIGKLAPIGSSDAAGAMPTADEYNALRQDVRRLYDALSAIARAASSSSV